MTLYTRHYQFKQNGSYGCPELIFSRLSDINARSNSLKIKSGYACINFDCSEWHKITRFFIKAVKNIEWYARIQDEYGACYFYALNENNEKYSFEFDQGGDLCDDENYEDEVMNNVNNWADLIPETLKTNFPKFIKTDDLLFDGP